MERLDGETQWRDSMERLNGETQWRDSMERLNRETQWRDSMERLNGETQWRGAACPWIEDSVQRLWPSLEREVTGGARAK